MLVNLNLKSSLGIERKITVSKIGSKVSSRGETWTNYRVEGWLDLRHFNVRFQNIKINGFKYTQIAIK